MKTPELITGARTNIAEALKDVRTFPPEQVYHRNLLTSANHLLGLVLPAARGIYYELLGAGVPLDNHESDLYCRDTPEAREILSHYPTHEKNSKPFIKGQSPMSEQWLDIPFAFAPYWEAKQK